MLSKAQHIRWSSAHPPPRDAKRRLEHMRVRIYGDVGIVNGTVVSDTQRTVFTDVFAFRDGRWQAVNAQENAIGVPLEGLSRDGFTALMNRLAQAWNQGDAPRPALRGSRPPERLRASLGAHKERSVPARRQS